MKNRWSTFGVLLLIILSTYASMAQSSSAQPSKAQELASLIAERSSQLNEFYPTLRTRGDERKKIATVTVFSEEAIKAEAARQQINATDDEVAAFLVPLLSRQGLIDISRTQDIRNDPNVAKWLAGQGWSRDQLFASGRVLLLWVKIATKDVSVTESEVKQYLQEHPTVHRVPARTQLSLSQFQVPAAYQSVSRGLVQAELFSPTLANSSRGAVTTAINPTGWEEIQLYLDIDQLDPLLRGQLEGKGVGDKFGPLQLKNGAVIAGKVSAILPPIDFANSPQIWQYAAILTRLEKANQKQEFDSIIKRYLDSSSPEVRGLVGDLFTIGGGAIGAIFGGVGAPIGAAVGGFVGNWVEGQMAAPGPAPMQAPMPAYYPGGGQGFNPYLQGGTPPFMPPWQGGFQQLPFPQFVPPMPMQYANQFMQWQNQFSGGQASFPWAPPFYSPFPMRYY